VSSVNKPVAQSCRFAQFKDGAATQRRATSAFHFKDNWL